MNTATQTLEQRLIETCRFQVNSFKKHDLPKFLDAVAKNPGYALSWASSFATEAAQAELYEFIAVVLESNNEVTVQNIEAELTARVLNAYTYTASSSSQWSNAMENTKQEVTRRVLQEVTRFIRANTK